ncbi:MAG: YkgJ family cysteine cluster protein [Candidatus Hodarchaeota archaeon]
MKKFDCLQCGKCCHEYEFAGEASVKRIPVFPEELGRLEDYARENNIKIKFIEDVVFPDRINSKILVITYKIILEGETRVCPFFNVNVGCLVNEIKPLACKAYPLAQKKIDAFNESIEIDPYCEFVSRFEDKIKKMESIDLKEFFHCEFLQSQRLMRKNQDIILKIRELTFQGKLDIPDKINTEEFDKYLKTWERVYLDDL